MLSATVTNSMLNIPAYETCSKTEKQNNMKMVGSYLGGAFVEEEEGSALYIC